MMSCCGGLDKLIISANTAFITMPFAPVTITVNLCARVHGFIVQIGNSMTKIMCILINIQIKSEKLILILKIYMKNYY